MARIEYCKDGQWVASQLNNVGSEGFGTLKDVPLENQNHPLEWCVEKLRTAEQFHRDFDREQYRINDDGKRLSSQEVLGDMPETIVRQRETDKQKATKKLKTALREAFTAGFGLDEIQDAASDVYYEGSTELSDELTC